MFELYDEVEVNANSSGKFIGIIAGITDDNIFVELPEDKSYIGWSISDEDDEQLIDWRYKSQLSNKYLGLDSSKATKIGTCIPEVKYTDGYLFPDISTL